jgi:hypothetical protein
MHPKLAGDAAAWPPPLHSPVGKVAPQGAEAQLRGSCDELLVGAAAPSAGGADLARRWGDVALGEQAVDRRGGGVQFLGYVRGTGLLLASCLEIAVKVGVTVRANPLMEAVLLVR